MRRVVMLAICGFAAVVLCMAMWPSSASAASGAVQKTARNGQVLTLNEKSLYVDSSLPEDDAAGYQFKTVHAAVAAAKDGTQQEPMVIYIEPDVYQMNGTLTDRGLYIDKDWVHLIGLSKDAHDVVLADNRGHTIGAQSPSGSSPAETIFVTGTGFHAENLTIGNYCNVDLVYPNDPSKNQPKRSSTITQAYAIGAGNKEKTLDHYSFKNVRFISMLDTLALGEVKRAYFEDSYIQGTDDFMGGGDIHVMKNTTLHSYSSKPIYAAGKNGMAFIDCIWEVDFADEGDLYLAKNSSTLYVINTAFNDLNGTLKTIQWAPYPSDHIQSYAYGVTLDGEPYTILPEENGLELSGDQLTAYTVYNLLSGADGWDPAHELSGLAAAQSLPADIFISEGAHIRSGEESVTLEAEVFPASASQHLDWSLDSDFAVLSMVGDSSVMVEGRHDGEEPAHVTVTATADNGITASTVITVYPSFVEPPKFTYAPKMSEIAEGKVTVSYELDLRYEGGIRADESVVTWYRVDDLQRSNPVQIAVSRMKEPYTTYSLTSGDVGHYVMASVAPKHARSHPGEAQYVISDRAVTLDDLPGTGKARYNISTDFEHFPTSWQPEIIPGGWTVDTYYPHDQQTNWTAEQKEAWEYAEGINGAEGEYGLLTVARGARLLYNPGSQFGDMAVHLELNPEKTAGQGFGSPNGQYMEVYIKYDPATETGYALRIERTTKYGIATDFTLYEYVNGKGRAISESISTTAFNPGAVIDLWVEGDKLYAKASTSSAQSTEQLAANLPNEVSLTADIAGNKYGGMGIQHTGTVSAGNRTQLTQLTITYADTDAKQEPNRAPEAAKGEGQPSVYMVRKGDTLSSIAQRLLGDPRQWVQIYEWNKSTIADPNRIYVGQKLIVLLDSLK